MLLNNLPHKTFIKTKHLLNTNHYQGQDTKGQKRGFLSLPVHASLATTWLIVYQNHKHTLPSLCLIRPDFCVSSSLMLSSSLYSVEGSNLGSKWLSQPGEAGTCFSFRAKTCSVRHCSSGVLPHGGPAGCCARVFVYFLSPLRHMCLADHSNFIH